MLEFDVEDKVEDPPAYKLHPVRGIVWAAFLGTPAAAGIVMAINYARTGSATAARIAVILSLGATVLLFAIISSIPDSILDRIPNAAFYVPQLMLVYAIANGLQSDLINKHATSGGEVASSWLGAGIGMLCLPVAVIALFGGAFAFEPSYGTLVEFGNDEIYYADEATEADARKLALVLKESGFFDDNGVSIRAAASSGKYTISFVLVENAWQDPLTVTGFRHIGQDIVDSGFPKPLTLELCNDYLEAQKTIRIE